ncbi:septal ring lytic transglycosylase RlpA family protein [Spirillospora sp. NBC_01491]|uniref:septal ring lytic transglycosylase RlpA family protein n=1 Tax=Spirillospora sp. NBC_01491 TaxID=2976007 RepID=UPI002E364D53|nr:septal ring lytic transglycosylase RlpA family protein [Spirillospora sp. NBC_01491]
MGSAGKHHPKNRLRTILIASGVAVAFVAAGAIVLLGGDGSAGSARAAQTAPRSTTPLADPPRTVPERADRGRPRAPEPPSDARPEVPSQAETVAKPKTEKAVKPKRKQVPKPRVLRTGSCEASFYWEGQMTASGERFDPDELTAAHKTLPMGSRVRVTNKNNGRSVTVRINDRGPYAGGRCLDLSKAAMTKVGGTGSGVIPVRYQVLART